jgi:hypothetical protein
MLTFLAAFDMTAELGSSAKLDRLHHAPLNPINMAGIGNAPRFAVAAEDVRYFQFAPPCSRAHPFRARVRRRRACRRRGAAPAATTPPRPKVAAAWVAAEPGRARS